MGSLITRRGCCFEEEEGSSYVKVEGEEGRGSSVEGGKGRGVVAKQEGEGEASSALQDED